MEFLYKKVRTSKEIRNLKLLIKKCPNVLPKITEVSSNGYFIEKCEKIRLASLNRELIEQLFFHDLVDLYVNKNPTFSPGIYLYFTNNKKIKDESSYFSHLFIHISRLQAMFSPYLIKTKCINDTGLLLEKMNKLSSCLEKWEPPKGFSLLHGDLYIGNIVRKNGKIHIIDYEYIRYGLIELEINNFIICSFMKTCFDKKNMNRNVDSALDCLINALHFSKIDAIIFSFFFYLICEIYFIIDSVKDKNNDLQFLKQLVKQAENDIISL